MSRAPFQTLPRGLGLRQRQRADGSWRVWWEPTTEARKAGALPVELDANRPTWSKRQAERLKGDAAAPGPQRTSSNGRTVDALIAEYKRSSRFAKTKPATQKGYVADFNVISKKWGGQPIASFDRPVIYTWYETLHGKTPTYASKLIRSFSILFSYAELLGWRPENSNPCFRLQLQQAGKRKRFATWAEYDALIASAEALGWPAMACAISLATFAAQRQIDVISAEIGAFDVLELEEREVWVWDLTRSKRGNLGRVPLHDELAPRVRALKEAAGANRVRLFHDDATGEPWSGDLFRKRWSAVRARAAKTCPSLLDPSPLEFRDLRRTFGVWARSGGALREDVGDVLGNSAAVDAGLGEVYMPAQLETAARAVSSIRRPKPDDRKRA
ncbi:hypothetical protein [uncultured Salipiger sp.]|uniref:tyrosine-type recombinase/integrase n=1 Tax=uncultured Salipiger sp. TaxID=499810 RepID=UPI00259899DD|nr:hypothetical protein [uncultured Salipiger sp.]